MSGPLPSAEIKLRSASSSWKLGRMSSSEHRVTLCWLLLSQIQFERSHSKQIAIFRPLDAVGQDGEVLRELGVSFPADASEKGEMGRAVLVILGVCFGCRRETGGEGGSGPYISARCVISSSPHCLMLIPPAISGYLHTSQK